MNLISKKLKERDEVISSLQAQLQQAMELLQANRSASSFLPELVKEDARRLPQTISDQNTCLSFTGLPAISRQKHAQFATHPGRRPRRKPRRPNGKPRKSKNKRFLRTKKYGRVNGGRYKFREKMRRHREKLRAQRVDVSAELCQRVRIAARARLPPCLNAFAGKQIDRDHLKKLLRCEMNILLDQNEANALFAQFDADNSGLIDYGEVLRFLFV